MIRVTVLYPSAEGSTFDIDYYANKHIPMVQGLLRESLKGGGVEKGIGTAEPGAPAPFMASGFIEFESVDDFESSFGDLSEPSGNRSNPDRYDSGVGGVMLDGSPP